MNIQFTVPAELQQFLKGLQSKALGNIVWDTSTQTDLVLPSNPNATVRSLAFDRITSGQYNCHISNVDGSNDTPLTEPRSI